MDVLRKEIAKVENVQDVQTNWNAESLFEGDVTRISQMNVVQESVNEKDAPIADAIS